MVLTQPQKGTDKLIKKEMNQTAKRKGSTIFDKIKSHRMSR